MSHVSNAGAPRLAGHRRPDHGGCQQPNDFNALIRSGAHPDLDPGVLVNGQYWYRDPASQSTTGLTNAIEFGVGF